MQVVNPNSESLYPISHQEMMVDFKRISNYDGDDLTLLKSIWLDKDRLEDNPSLFLMELNARPQLNEVPRLRRAYRVGVIAATIVVRDRLLNIGALDLINENPNNLTYSGENGGINWANMQDERIILSQFFTTRNDVKSQFQNTVEAKWRERHDEYLPTLYDPSPPKNDWMVVGMGDTLGTYGMQFARHTGKLALILAAEKLIQEPELFAA